MTRRTRALSTGGVGAEDGPADLGPPVRLVGRFPGAAQVVLGDALVNDVHREFWGREAIRRWVAREIVGDRVTVAVTEVLDHHGDTIVRGRYDGDYDKANLPDPLILTHYFTVRDGKIVTLIIIPNTPASY